MPGNFIELPGIRGRRRGDLNPIQASQSGSAFALQIKGSRGLAAVSSKREKRDYWGELQCESPQWGEALAANPPAAATPCGCPGWRLWLCFLFGLQLFKLGNSGVLRFAADDFAPPLPV